MKKIILLFLVLVTGQNIFGQMSESYVPLQVGNKYFYRNDYYGTGGQYSTYSTQRVTGDIWINGKQYFYHTAISENCVRYDSINHNYLIYSPGYSCGQYIDERIIDSMKVNLHDSVYFCNSSLAKICSINQQESMFGYSLQSVGFYSSSTVQSGASVKYTKGIGVTGSSSYGGHLGVTRTLVACLINGRVYGDTVSLSPVDTATASYFGVNKGDRYIFSTSTTHKKIKVLAYETTTVSQGKRYIWGNYYNAWVSFDTLNGCIIRTSNPVCGSSNYYTKIDSLRAGLYDTVKYCTGLLSKICTAYRDTTLLSVYTKVKTFTRIDNGKYLRETYAKKFSLVSFDIINDSNMVETYNLQGAVISGYVYGDTTSLMPVAPVTPEAYRYSLEQNYPNPFNPSTKINYELQAAGFVSLKLYDLTGRFISELLNETKTAGPYTFVFNSIEYNLSSGIYFYTLNAGEFKETRKMVLIK